MPEMPFAKARSMFVITESIRMDVESRPSATGSDHVNYVSEPEQPV